MVEKKFGFHFGKGREVDFSHSDEGAGSPSDIGVSKIKTGISKNASEPVSDKKSRSILKNHRAIEAPLTSQEDSDLLEISTYRDQNHSQNLKEKKGNRGNTPKNIQSAVEDYWGDSCFVASYQYTLTLA